MVNNKFVCEECHKEYSVMYKDQSITTMECCKCCSDRVKRMYHNDCQY